MKENHNILNLPRDLVEDLQTGRRIKTKSQGWFDIASIEEVQWRSVKIGPFTTKEDGQYYTNSVGLIKNSEAYDDCPEILVWLPRLGLYGTWDSSHDELHTFPNQTWTSMKSNLVPFIEAQWGSYKGNNKVKHETLESANTYAEAFDFIPYNLKETVKNIPDKRLTEFLKKYETAILRHPDIYALDDAYFALAESYFRLGQNDSEGEKNWKEKFLQILSYYPEGRFHHERAAAEMYVWASPEFGLEVFKNLLEKDKRQPEYAGGADLVSALLIHHPDWRKSILELSKVKENTIGVLRSSEVAKRRALTSGDSLNVKLKQNAKAMEAVTELISQIDEIVLSVASGEFSDQDVHISRHKKVADRIAQGWEYLRKKKYSKVEELLGSIFADYEHDAEALFLEARFFWLRSDSPEEGMKRAEKNLLLAAKGDLVGRSRLHNLIGCALDEMGKLKEAIEPFKKAEELSPKDSIYSANLAEIHWKLENKTLAVRYAKKAKNMGDKSPIVETILKDTAIKS
ncbi:tetratricopeptide repeat protein [Leptospira noguchii]|uniref:Tetratricopeptide repeat protein n=1 Tax=Leptospira noguchii serovar Panama str. CZ214 TaxID=1001595 RepID=T0GQY8_9LEPT|nr:tetratricopeptide repeat protein [Leptospira noguchii]EQA71332.1 tetratricopeptide repeat protein [Leptospira noguchii serovar Panama str. CZ214]